LHLLACCSHVCRPASSITNRSSRSSSSTPHRHGQWLLP
jgi:hypothetical protein